MPAPKKNKNAVGNHGGAPTKYDPKFCETILEFFDRNPYDEREIKFYDKNGKVYKTEIKMIPAKLPTLERFACDIGVDADTLLNWAKVHIEFFGAVVKAKNMQKDILIQNGLTGFYDAGFAKFVAINFTNMKDKTEVEHSTPEEGFKITYNMPGHHDDQSES